MRRAPPLGVWRMLRLGRPINVPESTAIVGGGSVNNVVNETASIADALLEQKMSDAGVDSWLDIEVLCEEELSRTHFRRTRDGNTGTVPETRWFASSSSSSPSTTTPASTPSVTSTSPSPVSNISPSPSSSSLSSSTSGFDDGNSGVVGNAGSPGPAHPFYEKCMEKPFLTSVAITAALCAASFLPAKISAVGFSAITGLSSVFTIGWMGYNYVQCES